MAIQDKMQRQIAAKTGGPTAALQLGLRKAADRLRTQTASLADEVKATGPSGEFTITYHRKKGRKAA